MKHTEAFTLVELILYVALLSIITTALISFAWSVIYSRVRTQVDQEIDRNLRLVSDKLTAEVAKGSTVSAVTASSLTVASPHTSRTPVTFDLASGRVRFGVGTAGSCPATSPCPLTSNSVTVTNLTFTDLAATNSANIRYSITITGSVTSNRAEYSNSQTLTGTLELKSR